MIPNTEMSLITLGVNLPIIGMPIHQAPIHLGSSSSNSGVTPGIAYCFKQAEAKPSPISGPMILTIIEIAIMRGDLFLQQPDPDGIFGSA